MIAVSVGDECKTPGVPRIEPQVLGPQTNAPVIENIDHRRIYRTDEMYATHIDTPHMYRFD